MSELPPITAAAPVSGTSDPKKEGTFVVGYFVGLFFGLIGVLICYFGTKHRTKNGAAIGFLSRFVFFFGGVVLFLAFDDPHARSLKRAASFLPRHSPGGFSVDLPAEPEIESVEIDDPMLGKFVVYRASVEEFGHIHFEPPVRRHLRREAFDSIVKWLFAGEIVESEPADLGDRVGELYLLEVPGGEGYCRVRIVTDGAKVVAVFACDELRDAAESKRVIGSLRFDGDATPAATAPQ